MNAGGNVAKYWFRKRRGLFSGDLGWGWVPISWQGWSITSALIYALYIQYKTYPNQFIIWLLVDILVFAFVADANSEEKVLFKNP